MCEMRAVLTHIALGIAAAIAACTSGADESNCYGHAPNCLDACGAYYVAICVGEDWQCEQPASDVCPTDGGVEPEASERGCDGSAPLCTACPYFTFTASCSGASWSCESVACETPDSGHQLDGSTADASNDDGDVDALADVTTDGPSE
jgi:hypothetical protein